MTNLTGKTALVTGASRGIGRGIATRLAADGARVLVHYGTNDTAAKATVTAIEAAGGRATAIGADLADPDSIDTLFAAVEAELAGAPLDILVNNAGIGRSAPLEATDRELFDTLFAVNTRAPFFIIQRALALLPDGGRIINISSAVARVAISIEPAYAMTKGAIEVLTRTLAAGLGRRNITVNAVAPGMTNTDLVAPGIAADPSFLGFIKQMTTLDRLGEPEDIAAAVAFLASEDGRWVTGQVLDASGGMWLGPRI